MARSGHPKHLGNVRYWVNSGKHLLALSFSGFGPITDLEAEAKPLLARLPGSYFNHSLRGTACRPGQSKVPV